MIFLSCISFAMATLPAIFIKCYQLIPHCLNTVPHLKNKEFLELDDDGKHKYVCTLCYYTVRRMYLLLTGDECMEDSTYRDYKDIRRLLTGDKNMMVVIGVFYLVREVGHIFAYVYYNKQIYHLESSLNDHSQMVLRKDIDEVMGYLKNYRKNNLVACLTYSSKKILPNKIINNRFNVLKKQMTSERNKPIKDILLANQKYNYSKT